MTAGVIIVGAGGHGRVLADALLAAGRDVTGFVDADQALWGAELLGLPVLGGDARLEAGDWPDHLLVNGIGVGSVRRAVQAKLEAAGRTFTGVRHPAAIVSRFARVDDTAQLLAGAVVQAGAEVGRACIVNTAAIVEHDCRVGAFAHCAPGSVLCGDVQVGANSHIGAGAVVREGIRLGDGTMVGAGAVVIKDFAGPGRLLGVPARDG